MNEEKVWRSTSANYDPEQIRAEEREKARRRAKEQERRERWAFPAKAAVSHQIHGETIVPCASPLAAVMCAAEIWDCDWVNILGAEVRRYEESARDAENL